MDTTPLGLMKNGSDEQLKKNLTWLLIGRIIAVLMLLVVAIAIHRLMKVVMIFDSVIWVAASTFGLSLIYGVLLRVAGNYKLQAYLQMVFDILLVTWLVQGTGTVQSPFLALYPIVIFVISCVTSRRGTYSLTSLVIGCYLFVVYRHNDMVNWGHQSTVLTHLVEILLISFLSSQLNEHLTRTDANLALANRKLNDIRALNELVIDSISSGLVTIDLQHQIMSFNRAAEEITGFSAAEVVGKHLNSLFPTISEDLDAGKSVLMGGQGLSRLNLECTTAVGRQIQLGFSVSPLTRISGEITGFVLPFQDLTDVMRLEKDVRRQDRLAALGRVAAAIAHEIRNPLASMRGAVQVLGSDAKLSDEDVQLMNIVLRESDRIDRIISDFLMYARPRQPEMESVNLNDLLEETLTLLRYSTEIDSSQYQLISEPYGEPALAFADPGQLRQVLWNLARNAIKAMPEGGTFKISINRTPDLAHFEIKFTDTGVGMTEEQIERIFEPFSSFTAGGTGLGMSIVYHIINEHRGKIDVSSEVNRGTTFTVSFAAYNETQLSQKAVSAMGAA